MENIMQRIRRRTFMGTVFAGLGITGISARPPKPKVGSIPMREFGKTGVKLTIVGQGGWALSLLRTKEAARAHTRHAYDLGINYFDTAHAYWNGQSEEVYGDVLADVRKNVFITSKGDKRTRAEADTELDLSLKRMKTDYVDLWQMHAIQSQDDVDKIFAPGGAMESYEAAKKAGKCRYIGFTGHHDPHTHVAMLKAYDKWDSILMPLHASDPHYLSFQEITLPVAVEQGIGIQAMKVFGNAFLLRVFNAQECLRYALSLPVHCATLGASTMGQLDDNVRVAQNFTPYTQQEMAEIAKMGGPGGLRGPELEYWKIGGEKNRTLYWKP